MSECRICATSCTLNLCTSECILDLLHSWKKASFPLWMSRGSTKEKVKRESVFFLRGEFFFLYIREQGNFSRWIVKNWTLCVQFFENAISVFCFSFGSIYWYINFVIFEMENSNFFEREFYLMNELWILRVHLMRLKNENENLQESKKTKIRTLVNLVASESFAHYANETFQVHFFFLCIYIILDICTRTGLYIISSIFLFFFLSYFFLFHKQSLSYSIANFTLRI